MGRSRWSVPVPGSGIADNPALPRKDSSRDGNLRAYQIASASRLAPFGYLSIVFATASGYLFFDEVPELRTLAGITIIIATLQAVAFLERRRR